MIEDPVFIIGTERSGSNLLRLLLNAHPSIMIPHPPHVMRDFAPFLRRYGDLREDRSFRRLVEDVASVVELHFAPWPFRPDRERLFRGSASRTLYGVYAGLYEQYREREGKRRWGCKSTFMFAHIDEILAHHARPRLIHLVRDPRDVAASAEKSVFSAFHPLKSAELWARQQQVIEDRAARLEPGVLLRVRYEDLTADPQGTMKRIMEFLGEEFQPEQLMYFQRREAQELSGLSASWRNCGEPVSTASVGRFRSRLSPREIARIESVAGPWMGRYGYEAVATEPAPALSLLERLEIESSEKLRWARTEARALLEDRNAKLRLKKRLFIRMLMARQAVLSWRNNDGTQA